MSNINFHSNYNNILNDNLKEQGRKSFFKQLLLQFTLLCVCLCVGPANNIWKLSLHGDITPPAWPLTPHRLISSMSLHDCQGPLSFFLSVFSFPPLHLLPLVTVSVSICVPVCKCMKLGVKGFLFPCSTMF